MDAPSAILVTGATGTTGRRVTAGLLAGRHRVKAASRNATPVAGAQAVRFDWNDPTTWAAESAGLSSPYQAEHYGWWHGTVRAALEQVPGVHDPDFTAHALLAAIRADLVAHLIDGQRAAPEELRSSLAAYLDNVLGTG